MTSMKSPQKENRFDGTKKKKQRPELKGLWDQSHFKNTL